MGIGTAIRHRLGRWEIPAAEFYRSCFISLDALGRQLAGITTPRRILEIGCGDGALAQRLTEIYPSTTYLGIDIALTAGRLYRGDPTRATFRTMSSTELRLERPEPFDLVIIADVLHHIPVGIREGVLQDASAFTAPAGHIAIKEWESDRPLFGKLAYWADLYVTGDKDVDFMTGVQLRALLGRTLPEFSVVTEGRIPPWRENILLVLSRQPAGKQSQSDISIA